MLFIPTFLLIYIFSIPFIPMIQLGSVQNSNQDLISPLTSFGFLIQFRIQLNKNALLINGPLNNLTPENIAELLKP